MRPCRRRIAVSKRVSNRVVVDLSDPRVVPAATIQFDDVSMRMPSSCGWVVLYVSKLLPCRVPIGTISLGKEGIGRPAEPS